MKWVDRQPRVGAVLANARRLAGHAGASITDEAWNMLGDHLEDRWQWVLGSPCLDGASVRQPVGSWNRCRRDLGGMTDAGRSMIDRISLQWIASAVELARRMTEDQRLIAEAMMDGADIGRVVSICAGLGDPHDGGRTVTAVTFESGLRVAYKPRSVRLLRAWGDLVREVEGGTGVAGFVLPVALDRGTHGWVSWIAPRSPACRHEVSLLNRRAGVIGALAYVLGSTDLHRENVIGHGASPVVVDAETLLWTEWRRPASVDRIRAAAFDVLGRDSILRTGLFPRWQVIRGRSVDGSALGHFVGDADSGISAGDLIEGLRTGYAVSSSDAGRRAILRFLDATCTTPSRAVLRPTAVYYLEMKRHLGIFGAGPPGDDSGGLARAGGAAGIQLVPREAEALRRLDVPRICVGDGSPARDVPGIDVAGSRGGYVRRRLAALCERDLRRQLLLARASLALRRPAPTVTPFQVDERDGPGRPSDSDLIAAADALGGMIMKGAVERSGSLHWITRRPVGSGRKWHLTPADFGLYDGNAGTALFLAALWRCTGDHAWLAASRSAIRPVGEAVRYDGGGPGFLDRFGIGGAEGLGGILLGLSLYSRITGEDADVEGAGRALEAGARFKWHRLELLYGAAGLLAGAIAAYDQTGSSRALEGAMVVGRRLAHEVDQKLHKADNGSNVAKGFAHGKEGIAAALGSLYARTGEAACGAAAVRLMGYCDERPPGLDGENRFEATEGEIQKASAGRPTDGGARNVTPGGLNWCRGAAGRLVACRCCYDAARSGGCADRNERERAALLTSLLQSRSSIESTLCCGLAGRLDVLLAVAQREQASGEVFGSTLPSIAAALLGRLQHGLRQEGRGNAVLPGQLARTELWPFAAGLYGGIAGVGYALLRMASPEQIPSPLLWSLDSK